MLVSVLIMTELKSKFMILFSFNFYFKEYFYTDDRVPEGLEDVSQYPNLFGKLLDNGWSEENLAKLAGLNLLRVFRDVEKVIKI